MNTHTTQKIDPARTPDLFKNRWLNALNRTHQAIPVSIFIIYGLMLVVYTKMTTGLNDLQIATLFLSGLVFFTFVEYMVHKYVYHMPSSSERGKRIAYVMHGAHHDYPKDKKRLALHPVLTLVISAVLFFLFELVLDIYSFSFLGGFVFGYAGYLIVHYMVHIYRPPNNFFKALWTNHAIHHYGDEDILYGVSSPLWDYVFGTLPKKSMKRKVKVGEH